MEFAVVAAAKVAAVAIVLTKVVAAAVVQLATDRRLRVLSAAAYHWHWPVPVLGPATAAIRQDFAERWQN